MPDKYYYDYYLIRNRTYQSTLFDEEPLLASRAEIPEIKESASPTFIAKSIEQAVIEAGPEDRTLRLELDLPEDFGDFGGKKNVVHVIIHGTGVEVYDRIMVSRSVATRTLRTMFWDLRSQGPDGILCKDCREVESSHLIRKSCLLFHHKLGGAPLFRMNLNLTERFPRLTLEDFRKLDDSQLEDYVRSLNIATERDVREIQVSLDIPGVPDRRLRVSRFAPLDGDVVERFWVKSGILQATPLATYAISDVMAAYNQYKIDLRRHWQSWAQSAGRPYNLLDQLYTSNTRTSAVLDRDLLEAAGQFAYAYRTKLGSAYISGDEKLGMSPVTDDDYPLKDKISLPRMTVAQGDRIATCVMISLQRRVCELLSEAFESQDPGRWPAVLAVVLTLCSFCICLIDDQDRLGRDNSAPDRWTEPEAVAQAQLESSVIVANFHRFQKKIGDIGRFLEDPEIRKVYDEFASLGDDLEMPQCLLKQVTESWAEWIPRPTFCANRPQLSEALHH